MKDLSTLEGTIRHLMTTTAKVGYEAASASMPLSFIEEISYGSPADRMLNDLLPLLRWYAVNEIVAGEAVAHPVEVKLLGGE
jgi:hypothetical protein